ncbi:hexokinase [Colletotrichum truncatum]|uniref:Hexokinase n=1 Tax=Colletotrichum truncatum TaxID=5467 RepID=A0ACC3YZH9_COLTU|nr:hexokinase [Colletotrichum truncatum]KAF6786222.1 hexokinase [Colletotrichum truncatum]
MDFINEFNDGANAYQHNINDEAVLTLGRGGINGPNGGSGNKPDRRQKLIQPTTTGPRHRRRRSSFLVSHGVSSFWYGLCSVALLVLVLVSTFLQTMHVSLPSSHFRFFPLSSRRCLICYLVVHRLFFSRALVSLHPNHPSPESTTHIHPVRTEHPTLFLILILDYFPISPSRQSVHFRHVRWPARWM